MDCDATHVCRHPLVPCRVPSLEYESIQSAAFTGLLHALEKYEPQGYRFSTYAYQWIRFYASEEVCVCVCGT